MRAHSASGAWEAERKEQGRRRGEERRGEERRGEERQPAQGRFSEPMSRCLTEGEQRILGEASGGEERGEEGTRAGKKERVERKGAAERLQACDTNVCFLSVHQTSSACMLKLSARSHHIL